MELACKDLHKKYGDFEALKGIDYTFTEGVYGLLGPNGAGKSTWIGLLTSNLKITQGEIRWNGERIDALGKEYVAKIGYVPQNQNLFPYLTGREFMLYMAALKGVETKQAKQQIPELLSKVNLSQQAEKKIRSYSGGMKQRLLIAQSLLGSPELIVMDEPTAGLDPRERIRIRNLISGISLNKIILIATHVVSDVEYISREILLLRQGELVKAGPAEKLESGLQGIVRERKTERGELDDFVRSHLVVEIRREQEDIYVRYLQREGGEEDTAVRPGLDDVYLYHFQEEGENVFS